MRLSRFASGAWLISALVVLAVEVGRERLVSMGRDSDNRRTLCRGRR